MSFVGILVVSVVVGTYAIAPTTAPTAFPSVAPCAASGTIAECIANPYCGYLAIPDDPAYDDTVSVTDLAPPETEVTCVLCSSYQYDECLTGIIGCAAIDDACIPVPSTFRGCALSNGNATACVADVAFPHCTWIEAVGCWDCYSLIQSQCDIRGCTYYNGVCYGTQTSPTNVPTISPTATPTVQPSIPAITACLSGTTLATCLDIDIVQPGGGTVKGCGWDSQLTGDPCKPCSTLSGSSSSPEYYAYFYGCTYDISPVGDVVSFVPMSYEARSCYTEASTTSCLASNYCYVSNSQCFPCETYNNNVAACALYPDQCDWVFPFCIGNGAYTPTTNAPTTHAPVTYAPTSYAPIGHQPSYHIPTSISPTTHSPATWVPTTFAPTSAAPTTITPTTIAPTASLAPVTAPPVTDSPVTVAPTSASPTTLQPATYAPTAPTVPTSPGDTIPPTTAAPVTFAPTSASPITIQPTTITPTSNAPSSYAPVTTTPTIVAPTTLAPTTLQPTTISPSSHAPSSVSPTRYSPTSTHPPTTITPTTRAPTSHAPITVAPTLFRSSSSSQQSGSSSDNTALIIGVTVGAVVFLLAVWVGVSYYRASVRHGKPLTLDGAREELLHVLH